MATSSLLSISRLLKSNTGRGMGARLHMQPPISAREIIRLASSAILPGWELVTLQGIAENEAQSAWHAGHVNEALVLDSGAVLLATDSGGVWLTVPDGHAPVPPVPLSNAWTDVDMKCLSLGSKGPRHVYAGGYNGILYETQTESLLAVSRFLRSNSVRGMAAALHMPAPISVRQILQSTDAPILNWAPVKLVDMTRALIGTDTIRQVVVVSGLQPPKIALATDHGVFWSDIPEDGNPYRFIPAVGMPHTRCLALALGSNNSVVASPQGVPTTADANGIYRGDWQSGTLKMQRSRHNGDIDFLQWSDAVVASSAGDRFSLYAAVSASGRATLSLRQAAVKAGGVESPLSVRHLAQKFAAGSPISLSALLQKIVPPYLIPSIAGPAGS